MKHATVEEIVGSKRKEVSDVPDIDKRIVPDAGLKDDEVVPRTSELITKPFRRKE